MLDLFVSPFPTPAKTSLSDCPAPASSRPPPSPSTPQSLSVSPCPPFSPSEQSNNVSISTRVPPCQASVTGLWPVPRTTEQLGNLDSASPWWQLFGCSWRPSWPPRKEPRLQHVRLAAPPALTGRPSAPSEAWSPRPKTFPPAPARSSWTATTCGSSEHAASRSWSTWRCCVWKVGCLEGLMMLFFW